MPRRQRISQSKVSSSATSSRSISKGCKFSVKKSALLAIVVGLTLGLNQSVSALPVTDSNIDTVSVATDKSSIPDSASALDALDDCDYDTPDNSYSYLPSSDGVSGGQQTNTGTNVGGNQAASPTYQGTYAPFSEGSDQIDDEDCDEEDGSQPLSQQQGNPLKVAGDSTANDLNVPNLTPMSQGSDLIDDEDCDEDVGSIQPDGSSVGSSNVKLSSMEPYSGPSTATTGSNQYGGASSSGSYNTPTTSNVGGNTAFSNSPNSKSATSLDQPIYPATENSVDSSLDDEDCDEGAEEPTSYANSTPSSNGAISPATENDIDEEDCEDGPDNGLTPTGYGGDNLGGYYRASKSGAVSSVANGGDISISPSSEDYPGSNPTKSTYGNSGAPFTNLGAGNFNSAPASSKFTGSNGYAVPNGDYAGGTSLSNSGAPSGVQSASFYNLLNTGDAVTSSSNSNFQPQLASGNDVSSAETLSLGTPSSSQQAPQLNNLALPAVSQAAIGTVNVPSLSSPPTDLGTQTLSTSPAESSPQTTAPQGSNQTDTSGEQGGQTETKDNTAFQSSNDTATGENDSSHESLNEIIGSITTLGGNFSDPSNDTNSAYAPLASARFATYSTALSLAVGYIVFALI